MQDGALPTDDLLLARRAAQAETAAWDEIVRRYGTRIYNLALSFAGDRTEAEDLTQEIFLKLYRNLRYYRGDTPLIAWALRLSRNLCIDLYRHNRTRQQAETQDDEILAMMPSHDDPHARVQAREQLHQVRRALASMPEAMAEILVLRDVQGLSYEEIAGMLALPDGTVKSRLNRARRELVLRLETEFALPTEGPLYPLEPVPSW